MLLVHSRFGHLTATAERADGRLRRYRIHWRPSNTRPKPRLYDRSTLPCKGLRQEPRDVAAEESWSARAHLVCRPAGSGDEPNGRGSAERASRRPRRYVMKLRLLRSRSACSLQDRSSCQMLRIDRAPHRSVCLRRCLPRRNSGSSRRATQKTTTTSATPSRSMGTTPKRRSDEPSVADRPHHTTRAHPRQISRCPTKLLGQPMFARPRPGHLGVVRRPPWSRLAGRRIHRSAPADRIRRRLRQRYVPGLRR